jgi:hypothetical protein
MYRFGIPFTHPHSGRVQRAISVVPPHPHWQ